MDWMEAVEGVVRQIEEAIDVLRIEVIDAWAVVQADVDRLIEIECERLFDDHSPEDLAA